MTMLAQTTREAKPFRLSQPAEQHRLNLTPPPKPAQALTERYRPGTLAGMVGQGAATFRLTAFLETPYSTAFLFDGPTGVGKTTAALAIASDLGAVEFGGLEIVKSGMQDAETVEKALDNLRFTPMLGSGWKVVVVDEADYMSPKASQVWLSALEDLPPRSVIIFTTNKPDKFQDRFLDRCERISFESDAVTHAQDAQALIDDVWYAETGRTDSPRVADLGGVADRDGHLSYRRVIRALEPLVSQAKAKAAPETTAPTPPAASQGGAGPCPVSRVGRKPKHDGIDWQAVAMRYQTEGRRKLAKELGVSPTLVYDRCKRILGI